MSRRLKLKNKKTRLSRLKEMFLDPVYAEMCEEMGVDPFEFNEDDDMGVSFPHSLRVNGKKAASGGVVTQFNNNQQQTVPAQTYKPCEHKGHDVVFEAEGKQLHAASMHGLNEYSGRWDLIIDLAKVISDYYPPAPFVRSKSAKCFNVLSQFQLKPAPPQPIKSELLALDWPDMAAPPVSLQFWQQLWQMLPAKTVACCMGGHGRTGTCLSALMIAAGKSYYDALDIIRNDHCKKAVETHSQEVYLHNLYLSRMQQEGLGHTAEYTYATANPPKAAEARKGWTGGGGTHKYWTCVNPQCHDHSCAIPSHGGWVEVGNSQK